MMLSSSLALPISIHYYFISPMSAPYFALTSLFVFFAAPLFVTSAQGQVKHGRMHKKKVKKIIISVFLTGLELNNLYICCTEKSGCCKTNKSSFQMTLNIDCWVQKFSLFMSRQCLPFPFHSTTPSSQKCLYPSIHPSSASPGRFRLTHFPPLNPNNSAAERLMSDFQSRNSEGVSAKNRRRHKCLMCV